MKKAEVKPGNVIVAIIVFSFIIASSFLVYSQIMVANDVTPDEGVQGNFSNIQADVNLLTGSDGTQSKYENASESPNSVFSALCSTSDNMICRALGVISLTTKSYSIVRDSGEYLKSQTSQTAIPESFWDAIIAILIISIVIGLVSVWWRYKIQ